MVWLCFTDISFKENNGKTVDFIVIISYGKWIVVNLILVLWFSSGKILFKKILSNIINRENWFYSTKRGIIKWNN